MDHTGIFDDSVEEEEIVRAGEDFASEHLPAKGDSRASRSDGKLWSKGSDPLASRTRRRREVDRSRSSSRDHSLQQWRADSRSLSRASSRVSINEEDNMEVDSAPPPVPEIVTAMELSFPKVTFTTRRDSPLPGSKRSLAARCNTQEAGDMSGKDTSMASEEILEIRSSSGDEGGEEPIRKKRNKKGRHRTSGKYVGMSKATEMAKAKEMENEARRAALDLRLEEMTARDHSSYLLRHNSNPELGLQAQPAERIAESVNMILKVARRSKNLKGTFIRTLKDAVEDIQASAEDLSRRNVSGETARLEQENASLKWELEALKKEVEDMRGEMRALRDRANRPPSPSPLPASTAGTGRRKKTSAPSSLPTGDATMEGTSLIPPSSSEETSPVAAPFDQEALIANIMRQVGGMVTARIDALANRLSLPPEPASKWRAPLHFAPQTGPGVVRASSQRPSSKEGSRGGGSGVPVPERGGQTRAGMAAIEGAPGPPAKRAKKKKKKKKAGTQQRDESSSSPLVVPPTSSRAVSAAPNTAGGGTTQESWAKVAAKRGNPKKGPPPVAQRGPSTGASGPSRAVSQAAGSQPKQRKIRPPRRAAIVVDLEASSSADTMDATNDKGLFAPGCWARRCGG